MDVVRGVLHLAGGLKVQDTEVVQPIRVALCLGAEVPGSRGITLNSIPPQTVLEALD